VLSATTVRADAPPDEEAMLPARREVPDYDGRPPAPATPAEKAVWIPRLLLSPFYLIAEYVLRRPLGFIVSHIEEAELPERALHFFRFGPDERFTLAPFFSYELGFHPNVGLLFRARDVGAEGHSISAIGAFGGVRWYAGRVTESYAPPGTAWTFALSVQAISRPDGLFYGLGQDVSPSNKARYHWVGTEASLGASREFFRSSVASLRAGYRYRRFDDRVNGRISIEDRIAQGRIDALPPGYVSGYSLLFAEARVVIDSRRPRPAPGSGGRIELAATVADDLRGGPSTSAFIVYAGSASGFLDLTGANHVLELTASVIFSDAFRGTIPFTELPTLSGNGPLTGFKRSYLIGESGAVLSLSYNWPVAAYLDGRLTFGVGNVFDGHLEGFAPSRLRMSTNIGVAAVSRRDYLLTATFGFGTDELGDGPNIQSVRVLVGATRDF
jgi:hypothetical protein